MLFCCADKTTPVAHDARAVCVCRVTTSLLYRVSHACSVQFTKVAVLRLKGAITTGIHARGFSHTAE